VTNQHAVTVVAILPCNDVDAAERWWNRLGFTRPPEQDYGDYRMLSDGAGGEIHLQPAVAGWLAPARNPFGVYVYSPHVGELAEIMRDEIIESAGRAEHKEWGMFEFALNGPDDLLVRVGWPSRLIEAGDPAGRSTDSRA
jgi:hypothetical protein